MVSRDTRTAISKTLQPGDNEDDVAEMIDLLADARAQAGSRQRNAADEHFAGAVFCVFLDPVKTKSYRTFVYQLRRQYRGIAKDDNLKRMFVDSLSDELLKDAKPEDSIGRGTDVLFRLPAGMP